MTAWTGSGYEDERILFAKEKGFPYVWIYSGMKGKRENYVNVKIINKMENNRTLKISLEKAKELYKTGDDVMKSLLLETFSIKELSDKVYPKNLFELSKEVGSVKGYSLFGDGGIVKSEGKITANYFATEEAAKSAKAFSTLSFLVEYYNEGWKPDWKYFAQNKYVVKYSHVCEQIMIYKSNTDVQFLAFKDGETAEKFAENCAELIKNYYLVG